MSAAAALDRRAERRRYGGALALVLAAHLLPFAAPLQLAEPRARGGGTTPTAVLLELAPPAPRPEPTPAKPAVAPPKPAPRPKAVAKREVVPPAPAPVPAELPAAPVPVPEEAKPPPPAGAPVAAAPGPTRGARGRVTWKGLVLGHLERFKRYPVRSRVRREEGVSWVHVTLDREGEILAARLLRSCGHGSLDREAVALVHRAAPLPKPPPEKPGARIQLEIPVEFTLRR